MRQAAAVLVGVIPAFVLLVSIFSEAPGSSSFTSFVLYALGRIGIVATLYAAFGAAFGLASPRLAWHWDLWLNIPAFFLLILFLLLVLSNLVAGDAGFGGTQELAETFLLFGFFVGALIAACLGAYAGTRVRHYFPSE